MSLEDDPFLKKLMDMFGTSIVRERDYLKLIINNKERSMKFTPTQAQPYQAAVLLSPGNYHYQVAMATNATSKNGNQMIKLVLTVEDNLGVLHSINDYLLESMSYKLRNFCKSTNLLAQYERGELNPQDCVQKKGIVKIIVEEGSYKPDGSRYPNRNSVKDYVVIKTEKQQNTIEDDEIAF